MACDAEPSVEVAARDRLIRLRDFLAELSDEQFNIEHLWSNRDGSEAKFGCGSAACIAGWTCTLFAAEIGELHPDAIDAQTVLGINDDQGDLLFLPGLDDGDFNPSFREWPQIYTRAGAVVVLDHLIATGKVDWSVAFKGDDQ